MKRILLISAMLTLVLNVGCQKAMEPNVGESKKVELKFATPVKVSATTDVLTRATTEALPDNTPISVKVFLAGETDFTKAILDAQYLASSNGYAVPKTENDRIMLSSAQYDIYFFLPQTTIIPNTGIVSVGNGVDFMSVKKTITVDVASANEGAQLVDVTFEHLVAAMNFKISADKYINSLVVTGCRILDVPTSATYDLRTAKFTVATPTNEGVTLTAADFSSTGIADQTVVTLNQQYAILPSAASLPRLEIEMEINGDAKKVTYDFTSYMKTGFSYQVNLTVNALGTATKWDVTVTPWSIGAAVDGGVASDELHIGSWRDGGIVFWIDPYNDDHYKVLDANERTEINWDDASTYATGYGRNWRLPTKDELNELYQLRKDAIGTSLLDKVIAEHFGRPIDNSYYWASTNNGAQATVVNLASGGVNSTQNKTSQFRARAIKDVVAVTANCYVTYPEEGVYKTIEFNALQRAVAKFVAKISTVRNVKGSNPASSTDAALSKNIGYQPGDKLEVVWQTAVNHENSGPMVIKSMDLNSDGIATVEVNGPGNAVVAYKRGATILWNYHIWATDSNPFVNHYPTGSYVNGITEGGVTYARFMDRNLGALSAAAMKPSTDNAFKFYGLLYQHGRPTPFTGQGPGTTINTYTKIFDGSGTLIPNPNAKDIGGYRQSASAVSKMTTAVQTPATYYTTDNSPSLWFTEDVSTWANYGTNKSIYDPCPYGYRVPATGSWNGLTLSQSTGGIDGGTLWSGTWWPATGIRWEGSSRGSFAGMGSDAYYWASNAAAAHAAYGVSFYMSGNIRTSYSRDRSTGFGIRCVEDGY